MTPTAKQFKTVEDYLDALPKKDKEALERLRRDIKKAAPQAEEIFSYRMPAFKYQGMLVWYAAFKSHYGIYIPNSKIFRMYKNELAGYESGKATLRFPLDKAIPTRLIAKIIKEKVKENLEKAAKKRMIRAKAL